MLRDRKLEALERLKVESTVKLRTFPSQSQETVLGKGKFVFVLSSFK
jgi:hypothetical protein